MGVEVNDRQIFVSPAEGAKDRISDGVIATQADWSPAFLQKLSDRAFEEYVNKTSGAGFKLEVVDDAKSLVLAKAGREDFVNPEGAPIVYTLRQAGWTDLVDIGENTSFRRNDLPQRQ